MPNICSATVLKGISVNVKWMYYRETFRGTRDAHKLKSRFTAVCRIKTGGTKLEFGNWVEIEADGVVNYRYGGDILNRETVFISTLINIDLYSIKIITSLKPQPLKIIFQHFWTILDTSIIECASFNRIFYFSMG